MPTAKYGYAGSPVPPAYPATAYEADYADPGKMYAMKAGQYQTKTGKYGSAKAPPYQPPGSYDGKKDKTWIEIELVDEDNRPVPGEAYRIELPDGSVAEGTLDDKGLARIDYIEPGECKITFPYLDKSAWAPHCAPGYGGGGGGGGYGGKGGYGKKPGDGYKSGGGDGEYGGGGKGGGEYGGGGGKGEDYERSGGRYGGGGDDYKGGGGGGGGYGGKGGGDDYKGGGGGGGGDYKGG
ncbi:MAG: hypothetical protein ABIZ04_21710, partial [Opitutus sp.]